jgi:hypothetical protein
MLSMFVCTSKGRVMAEFEPESTVETLLAQVNSSLNEHFVQAQKEDGSILSSDLKISNLVKDVDFNQAVLLMTFEETRNPKIPEIAKHLPEFIKAPEPKKTTEEQLKELREKTFARYNKLGLRKEEKGIDDKKLKRLSTLWDQLVVEKEDSRDSILHSEEAIKLLMKNTMIKQQNDLGSEKSFNELIGVDHAESKLTKTGRNSEDSLVPLEEEEKDFKLSQIRQKSIVKETPIIRKSTGNEAQRQSIVDELPRRNSIVNEHRSLDESELLDFKLSQSERRYLADKGLNSEKARDIKLDRTSLKKLDLSLLKNSSGLPSPRMSMESPEYSRRKSVCNITKMIDDLDEVYLDLIDFGSAYYFS